VFLSCVSLTILLFYKSIGYYLLNLVYFQKFIVILMVIFSAVDILSRNVPVGRPYGGTATLYRKEFANCVSIVSIVQILD
jgi:hypothetical protein